MRIRDDKEVIFTTLGMAILDDNYYDTGFNKPHVFNVLGGGGTYAIVGARIVAGKEYGELVSGFIDQGYDFPHKDLAKVILSWETGLYIRYDDDRATTRGVNLYRNNGYREFSYKNEKKQIMADDVIDYGLGKSKSFHLICSMERAEEIVGELESYAVDQGRERPLFIYEPVPNACLPENLEELLDVLPKVDIFTPNLEEAADLVDRQIPTTKEEIRDLATVFFPHIKEGSAIVVRCGKMGCYVKTHLIDDFFPSYHQDEKAVVDETGAGNGFCGALMTAYILSGGNLMAGVVCGTIASGCIIEKLGIPTKTVSEGKEMWNELSFQERLDNYLTANPDLLKYVTKETFNWNYQLPQNEEASS